MIPQERFAALAAALAGDDRVTLPQPGGRRSFGSTALTTGGSIFAMLSGDRLVVKLPRDRVAALIEDGTGLPFDAGKGRPMKEWLTLRTVDLADCLALAREALDFVSSKSRPPRA